MTLSVRALHEAWAWVVVVGNGGVGLWALGAHWRPGLRHRALWWCTGVAEVAVLVQVVAGVVLVAGQGRTAPDLHMVYGYVALVTVGIVYSYRQQLRHRLYLLYGFGGLFLMGLGIRAMVLR